MDEWHRLRLFESKRFRSLIFFYDDFAGLSGLQSLPSHNDKLKAILPSKSTPF